MIVVLFMVLIYLALIIAMIAGWWKMFEKAGQPGWAAIIPIYNFIILMKVVNRPTWWVLPVLFIPFFVILVWIDLAKSFGKDVGFAIGLTLLLPIFICILGFGSAQYTPIQRPEGQGN